MENKEHCIICFEEIECSEMIRKWECNHNFHKNCIECWEKNCPICRNENLILPEITFQISRNPTCPIWLQNMSQYCPTLSPNQFIHQWKDTDCIQNRHDLIFIVNDIGIKKNIYAICKDCNSYQVINHSNSTFFYPIHNILLNNRFCL